MLPSALSVKSYMDTFSWHDFLKMYLLWSGLTSSAPPIFLFFLNYDLIRAQMCIGIGLFLILGTRDVTHIHPPPPTHTHLRATVWFLVASAPFITGGADVLWTMAPFPWVTRIMLLKHLPVSLSHLFLLLSKKKKMIQCRKPRHFKENCFILSPKFNFKSVLEDSVSFTCH